MDRAQIVDAAKTYFKQKEFDNKFEPGVSYIPPTGKVMDHNDCGALIELTVEAKSLIGNPHDILFE